MAIQADNSLQISKALLVKIQMTKTCSSQNPTNFRNKSTVKNSSILSRLTTTTAEEVSIKIREVRNVEVTKRTMLSFREAALVAKVVLVVWLETFSEKLHHDLGADLVRTHK